MLLLTQKSAWYNVIKSTSEWSAKDHFPTCFHVILTYLNHLFLGAEDKFRGGDDDTSRIPVGRSYVVPIQSNKVMSIIINFKIYRIHIKISETWHVIWQH